MFILLSAALGCNADKAQDSAVTERVVPPECAEIMNDELFLYLSDSMDILGLERRTSWGDFYPHQAAYLLYAPGTNNTHCYFLLGNDGSAIEAAALQEAPFRPELAPDIALPYAYLWPWTGDDNQQWATIIDIYGAQPADLQAWAAGLGVQLAPIVPATRALSDEWYAPFGQSISNLVNLQLLIHEGFHVSMQSPSWVQQAEHSYPEWTSMAVTQDLASCYPSSIRTEQMHLVAAMSALFEDENSDVCPQAQEFVANRSSRWTEVADVEVGLINGETHGCAVAEGHMELLEGLADYASWFYLHNLGLATDSEINSYMSAVSNTPYYRTGAMQLFVLQHWLGAQLGDVAAELSNASSIEDANIYEIFRQETVSRCSN